MTNILIGETNGSRFELFALLGEAYGSGLPLAFLLISSNGVPSGAKERVIQEFLDKLVAKWKLKAAIILTDKDKIEINACRRALPNSKHQLCFWHAIRAVKVRLATLRRAPAFYNVDLAREQFSWIKADFLPIGQMDNPATVRKLPLYK